MLHQMKPCGTLHEKAKERYKSLLIKVSKQACGVASPTLVPEAVRVDCQRQRYERMKTTSTSWDVSPAANWFGTILLLKKTWTKQPTGESQQHATRYVRTWKKSINYGYREVCFPRTEKSWPAVLCSSVTVCLISISMSYTCQEAGLSGHRTKLTFCVQKRSLWYYCIYILLGVVESSSH